MTTELATMDGEIIEQRAPMTLFGTDDPSTVVDRASAVATALATVIGERNLTTRIGNKDHVQVEGWTLLGSMLGVFAEVEWTRPIEGGWEARAVARTLNANVVGAAEAMCTRKERTWGSRDEYALRSMAQTRAVSKALRMPLGFIMHLAGYSATPAEEVPDEQPEQSRGGARASSSPSAAASVPRNIGEAKGRLAAVLAEHGMTFTQAEAKAKELGIDRGSASVDDILRLIAAIEQPDGERALLPSGDGAASVARGGEGGSDLPAATDTPLSEGIADSSASDAATGPVDSPRPPAPAPTLDDILAVTGGEVVPPKPRSAEFAALPSEEKLAARVYWQEHAA